MHYRSIRDYTAKIEFVVEETCPIFSYFILLIKEILSLDIFKDNLVTIDH